MGSEALSLILRVARSSTPITSTLTSFLFPSWTGVHISVMRIRFFFIGSESNVLNVLQISFYPTHLFSFIVVLDLIRIFLYPGCPDPEKICGSRTGITIKDIT